jgi:tRNA threonylcarbamoyladenosine biosynthesis protein TsaB
MLLLAADTSGKNGSIALANCNGENCSVIDIVPLLGGTFSAQLVPQISGLLSKHGFSKGDIGGFAVASGPGSFTGLRVGLAAIKGLAEILGKPIAAVSLLETLAVKSAIQEHVVAILDAGRNELYVGEYQIVDDAMRVVAEKVVPRPEFLQEISRVPVIATEPTIATELRAAGRQVIEAAPPTSADVAMLGWRKIQLGETVLPEELEANYIRRSDAEIFAKTK